MEISLAACLCCRSIIYRGFFQLACTVRNKMDLSFQFQKWTGWKNGTINCTVTEESSNLQNSIFMSNVSPVFEHFACVSTVSKLFRYESVHYKLECACYGVPEF